MCSLSALNSSHGVFHDGGDLITLRADRQDRAVSIEVTTVDHLPRRDPTTETSKTPRSTAAASTSSRALTHGYRVVRHDNERVTACSGRHHR